MRVPGALAGGSLVERMSVLLDDVTTSLDAYYDEVGDPWRGRVPTLEEMLDVVFPPGARDAVGMTDAAAAAANAEFQRRYAADAERRAADWPLVTDVVISVDPDGMEVCPHGSLATGRQRCVICSLRRWLRFW